MTDAVGFADNCHVAHSLDVGNGSQLGAAMQSYEGFGEEV